MTHTVHKYKVTIFGDTYFFVSDEGEDIITEAAQQVDLTMREIAQKGAVTESKKMAVLVAMQAFSKFLASEKQREKEQMKNDHLMSLLDNEIARLIESCTSEEQSM